MSLRARLLLVTVLLVAVGLTAANIATFHFVQTFLQDRVDEQLVSSVEQAARGLGLGPFGGAPPDVALPPGVYAEYRDASGQVVQAKSFGYGPQPVPSLPDDMPTSDVTGPASIFDVPAQGGGPGFRALALTTPDHGTLVVAVPLTDVTSTLGRLVRIELVVSVIVLGAAAALAWWLVRLGMRPLEGIGETAGAIAAGDLSQRVSPADERTEVGRLGLALNSMLAQIEAAFDERRRSEDRLRRFVADASHELRTPLTSIRGYAELFRRGAQARPEDLTKSMARIEAEASRMGVLVDDLLLLARLDQGRPLGREPVDLDRVTTEAVEAARAVDPDRPIDLDVRSPARVIGDEGRLRQVLDNLLDNARVHTGDRTPVHVRVAPDGDAGVVLTVGDEGGGLSPDAQAKVFERFYRGDPARSRETGGAGLGLSIVAAIVGAHGGTVDVTSPDGGGTAFEVHLPVNPPPSAEGDVPSATA
jgi:two-component system, OmpR family, sensor kinase